MEELITSFPEQLHQAISFAREAVASASFPQKKNIQNIYLAGMGGSAIGGDFVEAFSQKDRAVPMQVGKGYSLPAWVGENTLAIASSYSGNTEETIASLEEMIRRRAQTVVISSGGRLREMARENGLPFLQLPEGQPAPRAALGWSLLMQLELLRHYDLVNDKLIHQAAAAADLLRNDQEQIKSKALRIAGFLADKIPLIYTGQMFEAVALRFRQQLAENANMLACHHVFPEMNHNELVGWSGQYPKVAAVYLRSQQDEHPRISLRMEVSKEIITRAAGTFIEVHAKGHSSVERSLYLVHLTDWVSFYAAEKRGVDAMDIAAINFLKGVLSRQK